jgi:endonuclease/exonuclease/phosphatase family metal-dependent hydrolase
MVLTMKIKFVNLNILDGGKLKNEITDFLHKEKPDILTLQEVWQNPKTKELINIDEFISGLGLNYFYFSPAFGTYRFGPYIVWGNAIFSKVPIIKTETKSFDFPYTDNYIPKIEGDWNDTPRNIQYVEIDMNGKKINVFNVQGIWGFNGDDTDRRLSMGKTIAKLIKGKDKVILAGDFNVQETSKTIGLIEKYVTNIFKKERITSFNMLQKPPGSGYKEAIVDLVMITSDIKVISHIQPNVNVSDHLPQVCEFDL